LFPKGPRRLKFSSLKISFIFREEKQGLPFIFLISAITRINLTYGFYFTYQKTLFAIPGTWRGGAREVNADRISIKERKSTSERDFNDR